MLCCSECFSSSYLKEIINSNSTIGNCDFCGTTDISTYNPRELALFFQNIFDLYKANSTSGNSIEIQIENDFQGKIFSAKINANRKQLLNEIIFDDFEKYKKLFKGKAALKHISSAKKNNQVRPLQISWEKFAEEIKSTNRFHIQNALDLSKLKHLLNRYVRLIPKGKKYCRARISQDSNGFKVGEMKNPPPDKAKAGRANPIGISYLYIANDIKTTLYEARASLFDYVTVGDFRLKEDIKVINLRGDTYDPIKLAENEELEDFLIHLPFITKLEQELSKPRRRSDNELDYLPTQYLSEFIKSMGFDGVEFQSSLFPSGYNIAIFNPTKFECIKTNVYEIENIDLTYKTITK
jgi:RES domain/HEPN/RES N-terminal domain 1